MLSTDAVEDIDKAVQYYNTLSDGLGLEFANTIDPYFRKILALPSASATRYDQIRVKPVENFPFTIYYTFTERQIIILRVFNTNQRPISK